MPPPRTASHLTSIQYWALRLKNYPTLCLPGLVLPVLVLPGLVLPVLVFTRTCVTSACVPRTCVTSACVTSACVTRACVYPDLCLPGLVSYPDLCLPGPKNPDLCLPALFYPYHCRCIDLLHSVPCISFLNIKHSPDLTLCLSLTMGQSSTISTTRGRTPPRGGSRRPTGSRWRSIEIAFMGKGRIRIP